MRWRLSGSLRAWGVGLLALILGGCSDHPATWVAVRGPILVGAIEAPDAGRVRALLHAWLEAQPPPDRPEPSRSPVEDPASLLPESGAVPGWEREGTVRRVDGSDPQALWDFVRREVEPYQAFGLRAIVSADYRNRALAEYPLLRVDVYDFGTPENAFGFYSHRRLPHGEIRTTIGAESFVGVRELHAWKDRFYFYVYIREYATETHEAMLQFGRRVGRAIQGVDFPPPLLRILPMKGIVRFSPRWFRTLAQLRDAGPPEELLLLNLDESTRGFLALMELNEEPEQGNEPVVFYVLFSTPERAREAYRNLVSQWSREESVRVRPVRLGEEGMRLERARQ